MSEIRDDKTLLQQLQEGDQEAFSAIYNKYHGPCILLGRAILGGSVEVAADLVHDIFATWWLNRTLHEFGRRDRADLEKFVKQAVRNRCITYLEKKRKECEFQKEYSLSDTHQTEIVYETGDIDLRIKMFLDRLKPMPRNMITEHYLEQYDVKELAEKWGVSSQVIRNHLHRGLQKIRKHLKIS